MLLPGSGHARREILGRYWCDGDINLARSTGDFAARLGCDSNELLRQEWRAYVCDGSSAEITRMAMDLKAGRGGVYAICNVSKHRERFYTTIRSMVRLGPADSVSASGVTILEAWESPRRYLLPSRQKRM